MAKLTLQNIAAGFALISTINNNNDLIEALFEKTLSLDGTVPNAMTANLDMNSQAIVNLPDAVNNQSPVTLAQLNAASIVVSTVLGTAVTIADAADNFVATTAEGAFAEMFTGPKNVQIFTQRPIFRAATGILIQDVTEAASVQIFHNGIDMVYSDTGTTDVDFSGGLGQRFFGPNNTDSLRMFHDNTAFHMDGNLINGIRIHDNVSLRDAGVSLKFSVFDSTETDAIEISHNGTDAIINGITTADLNITGFTGLSIETANLGFYSTVPVAKQTGVAVTADGIHAALVNLGLIAA